jgi:hypothetical protein
MPGKRLLERGHTRSSASNRLLPITHFGTTAPEALTTILRHILTALPAFALEQLQA